MQTMLLLVTATMWLLSCLARGTFLLFSKWSSCNSGHINLVVGSITFLIFFRNFRHLFSLPILRSE